MPSETRGLYIALDNRSVVDRGNAILSGAFVSRKPWGLLNDGDLWQTFADAIKMRGAHSVALTWTKGHSSWQRIASSSSHANAIGNSIADAAADHGFEAANQDDIHHVLEHHAAKHQAYCKLVARLQNFAAKLLLHDSECRREAGIDTRSKNLVVYLDAPPPTPRQDFIEGDSLYLHPLPPDMFDSHKGLHVFWDSTRWVHSDSSRPTTWIELFAIYRLWGGGEQEEGPHARRPRLAALIKSFVQQSKRLLRTYGNGESELLTSAYRGKACVLETFGMCMHVPAIKAKICLSQEVGNQLHKMLLSIRAVKQGPESGKLKASAAPLPRLEPWRAIMSHTSPPSPSSLRTGA